MVYPSIFDDALRIASNLERTQYVIVFSQWKLHHLTEKCCDITCIDEASCEYGVADFKSVDFVVQHSPRCSQVCQPASFERLDYTRRCLTSSWCPADMASKAHPRHSWWTWRRLQFDTSSSRSWCDKIIWEVCNTQQHTTTVVASVITHLPVELSTTTVPPPVYLRISCTLSRTASSKFTNSGTLAENPSTMATEGAFVLKMYLTQYHNAGNQWAQVLSKSCKSQLPTAMILWCNHPVATPHVPILFTASQQNLLPAQLVRNRDPTQLQYAQNLFHMACCFDSRCYSKWWSCQIIRATTVSNPSVDSSAQCQWPPSRNVGWGVGESKLSR